MIFSWSGNEEHFRLMQAAVAQGSLLSSDSCAFSLSTSTHHKIWSEKPGNFLTYLTVRVACLQSVAVAVSEARREGQTGKI